MKYIKNLLILIRKFYSFKFSIYYFLDNPWIAICIILVISVLLRLPNLNESLWYDELWSTNIKLAKDHLFSTMRFDTSPPLYSILMFIWIRLFGDSEISIRIPPLIFGFLSIFLTYSIASRFTDKKNGILAAFLMCLSPVHIWYSQEARPYSAVLFFLLLSLLSFYKLKEAEMNARWYFIYFISLFMAVFSFYFAVAYLVALSIISFFEKKMGSVRKKVLIINGIIIIFFCLFFIWHIKTSNRFTGRGHLRSFNLFELWMLFFNWFLFGNSLWDIGPNHNKISVILKRPAMLYVQVFFLIIFVRGLVINHRNSKSLHKLDIVLYLFLLPLALLVITFAGIKHIYIERGAFFILPFFYMVLARGATKFKSKSVAAICTIITVMFAIASLFGFLTKNDRWTVYKLNPNWRTAVDYLDTEIRNSDKPLFVFVVAPDSMVYYLERKKITPEQMIVMGNETIFYKELLTKNAKTFYLIKNKWRLKGFDNILNTIRKDPVFHFLSSSSFEGLEIFKFKVADNPSTPEFS